MDITGLNKASVLAALYNGSKQQGMGFIHARGSKDMSVEEAQVELNQNPKMYFDYLHGRVMKIDLSRDDLDTRLYNRDLGEGAAERILKGLIENNTPQQKMKVRP